MHSPWLLSWQHTALALLQNRSTCQLPKMQIGRKRGDVPSAAAANTDDGDCGAGQADESIDVLNDDAKEAQLAGDRRIASLPSGLAALDGSGDARAGRLIGSRGGDRKDGESGEEGEFAEHGYSR